MNQNAETLEEATGRSAARRWQPVEEVGVWSNFRREDVFFRKTSTENLDLTPSVHFFNRLLVPGRRRANRGLAPPGSSQI